MKLVYQARTKEGDIKSGIIEASSKESALALLQKMDLFVTYLEEEKKPVYFRQIKILKKITFKDLVLFFRQLSIMINSKIPIVEALSTIAAQTKNLDLKEIILDVSHEVEAGGSLSKSFSVHKKVFSSFQIAMIKAGEASGKLSQCLNYLADHMEREYNLRSKTTGALIYPAMVLIMFLGIGTMMLFSVLPSFEEIFKEAKVELPLFTKIALFISHILRNYIFYLLLFFAFLIFGISYYIRTPEGRRNFDRFSLKIPYLGKILKESAVVRFASNFATLSSAGLTFTESLEIVEEIIGNKIYREIIVEIKEAVKKGISVSSITALYPDLFPPIFTQMVLVGEKTGNLDNCLMTITDFYQKEIERSIENFLKFLEPALIILLAVLVGGLMASVLIPLYKIIGTY